MAADSRQATNSTNNMGPGPVHMATGLCEGVQPRQRGPASLLRALGAMHRDHGLHALVHSSFGENDGKGSGNRQGLVKKV